MFKKSFRNAGSDKIKYGELKYANLCCESPMYKKQHFSKKKIMEIFFFLASFHLIIHESNNHLLSVYYAFSFFHLIFSYGRETEIGI